MELPADFLSLGRGFVKIGTFDQCYDTTASDTTLLLCGQTRLCSVLRQSCCNTQNYTMTVL